MEDYCYSPEHYWKFRAGFLLEAWKAEPQSIAELLEGCILAAGGAPSCCSIHRL